MTKERAAADDIRYASLFGRVRFIALPGSREFRVRVSGPENKDWLKIFFQDCSNFKS